MHQEDLIEIAIDWEWQRDQVDFIDDDTGTSGAAAEHRAGYQRLVSKIEADEYGILFIAEWSRAGRDDLEWHQLLVLCRVHDVLIWANWRVYDLQNSGDFLTARLMTTVVNYENELRRDQMAQGRDAKARKGMPVAAAPAGYIRDAKGKWLKDADPAVRNAMDAVFRAFREGGSLRRAVDLLLAWEVRLPRRTRKGVRWVPPSIGLIQSIIKHPAYAGCYVFGRRRTDPSKGRNHKGRLRSRKAEPGEVIMCPGTHEPYISQAEFDANQQRLKLNSNGPGQGKTGEGPALVNSILRCGNHRTRAFAPAYKPKRRDGRRSYSYFCQGDYQTGGDHCVRFPGNKIDPPIVDAVLGRLTPVRIEKIKEEYERLQADDRGERYRLETELRQAKQDVADIEYRYTQSDRANRFVRSDLESKLESALRRQDHLERRLRAEESKKAIADEEAFADLERLCSHVDQIFWAETTTNLERKQILRLMLDRAVVIEHSPEHARLLLVWSDGSEPTEMVIKLGGYAHRIIEELAANGTPCEEIVERLSKEGLTTKYGAPWSLNSVRCMVRRLRGGDVGDMRSVPVEERHTSGTLQTHGGEQAASREGGCRRRTVGRGPNGFQQRPGGGLEPRR